MNKRELTMAALLLLALGMVFALVRALDLIGAETLRVLALVLAVPGGIALMSLGLTPLVRAWRLPLTPPVERHIIKEVRLQQQHTIDRRAPDLAPLPAVRQLNLYPGLQSAEWRAGLLTDGGRAEQAGMWREPAPAEVESFDEGWPDWR